jgi:integrase
MANIQERTTQSGEVRFRVQVRIKGKPSITKTFKRKTDAKRWAQEKEHEVQTGLYFRNSESEKHLLSDAIDRYIRDVIPTIPKSGSDRERHLLVWKKRIGGIRLSDVTTPLVSQHRDELKAEKIKMGKKRSPATVNRYLTSLSHLFSIACNDWEWSMDNPVKRVSKLKEPSGRVRYLDEDERDRLLNACRNSENASIYLIVLLALTTGMRRGEILKLKWKDINIDKGLVTILEPKNGELRSVPLVGEVIPLLAERSKIRRIDTPLVFPGTRPRSGEVKPLVIRATWKNVLEEANIKDFRFHDLRHTAGSYLAMSGASEREIQEILGHRTTQMTKRYTHLSQEHTRGVIERMTKAFNMES